MKRDERSMTQTEIFLETLFRPNASVLIHGTTSRISTSPWVNWRYKCRSS